MPKQVITLRNRRWLYHYLNASDQKTFLNKTESAVRAGYSKRGKKRSANVIGVRLAEKWRNEISEWFEKNELSEADLKIKLLEALNAADDKGRPLWNTRIRALELAIRMRGLEKPSKVEITGYVEARPLITDDMSDEEAAEVYRKYAIEGRRDEFDN